MMRSQNWREPPRTPRLLSLSKEDVKDAPLTCSTELLNGLVFDFGFTAGGIFYRMDSMKITEMTFFHDQKKLELLSTFKSGHVLKLEIRASSIIKMNFEIDEKRQAFTSLNPKLTINVAHPPFFWKEKTKGKFVRINPLEDGANREFWKKFIESTAYQLSFNIPKSDLEPFMNQMYQLNIPCGITFNFMKVAVNGPLQLQDLDIYMEEWDWNLKYMVQTIKDCGAQGSYFLNYILFEKARIQRLDEFNAARLFASMLEHLKNDLTLSSLDFTEHDDDMIRERLLNDNYVRMKTIYVTPTRYIATSEDWTMDSRGLRFLNMYYEVIQIKFRDDDMTWFPYELAYDVIKPTCQYGVYIANEMFNEFGGSNSLFRDFGAYFCSLKNKNDILETYMELGIFEPATAAKMAARVGQYFTSARCIKFQLRQSSVLTIDDILSNVKNSAGEFYNFTDGNGLISRLFAKQISDKLELSFLPSAFQIRYAGCKGMLTVDWRDPQLIDQNGDYWALFRKSQNKFKVPENDYLDFDIVDWAKPAPFNLYRTFIAILDHLAVNDGKAKVIRVRLRELATNACYKVLLPLIDNHAFMDTLQKLPKFFPVSKMENQNLLMNDPFLRSMVEANALKEAKLLATKIQIPLPSNLARTAFGIADHTRTLKPDQIYFRYTVSLKSGGGETRVLTGRAGITRSPIYHSGDVRFYEAVDIPELSHLVNVVVFPTVGDRPIADMLGGGDLDGDAFGIFWDPALILDRNAVAGEFLNPAGKSITINQLQDEFPQFRAEYQEKRNVEVLSNSHLAHLATNSADSAECESLSKRGDAAVNYPKSGVFGGKVEDHERHRYWPTFMGKTHEPAYESCHILCELHGKVNAFEQLIQIAVKKAEVQRAQNGILERTNSSYRPLFDEYKRQIHGILTKYQIPSEGQLFANAFGSLKGTLTTQNLPLINESGECAIVEKQARQIFKHFRSKLLDQFSPGWREDKDRSNDDFFSYKSFMVPVRMILAARDFYKLAQEDKTCFSFPWLLWEGLDDYWKLIPKKSGRVADKIEKDFQTVSSESLSQMSRMISYQVKQYSNINGFEVPEWRGKFIKMFQAWINNAHLEEYDYPSVCKNFLLDYSEGKIQRVANVNEAFLLFLKLQYQQAVHVENVNQLKLYKAAEETLIKIAFLPDDNLFDGISFNDMEIDQQCIVVCIPKNWTPEFERDYQILKRNSGCREVSIAPRRTFADVVFYSVMFKGTLKACNDLKKSLTPKIELTGSNSMRETKMEIAEKSNELLNSLFHFQRPLKHSSSAPGKFAGNIDRRNIRRRR